MRPTRTGLATAVAQLRIEFLAEQWRNFLKALAITMHENNRDSLQPLTHIEILSFTAQVLKTDKMLYA